MWQRQGKNFKQSQYQYLCLIVRALGKLNEPISPQSIMHRLHHSETLFVDYCTYLITTVSLNPKVDLSKVSQIENNIDITMVPIELQLLELRAISFIHFFEQHVCDDPIFLALYRLIQLPRDFRTKISQDTTAIIGSLIPINGQS